MSKTDARTHHTCIFKLSCFFVFEDAMEEGAAAEAASPAAVMLGGHVRTKQALT